MKCPLCMGLESIELESIRICELVKMWKRHFRINIKNLYMGNNVLIFKECKQCGLRYFNPLIAGDETIYNNLQKFDWYYPISRPEFEYVKQFVHESDCVLEIGAGYGKFGKMIQAKEYTGLELNPQAVSVGVKNGIKLYNQTIEEHVQKFPEKYDIVCSLHVLEHVVDVHSFIENSMKCLKTTGLLIYSVPSEDSYVSLVPNALQLLNMPPHHLTRWTDKAINNLTTLFPLEIEKINYTSSKKDIFYSSTVVYRAMNKILKRKYNYLDSSWCGEFLYKLSLLSGKFYLLGLEDEKLLPRGGAVNIVFRKK